MQRVVPITSTVTPVCRPVEAATACSHGRTFVLRQAAGLLRICLECGERRDI